MRASDLKPNFLHSITGNQPVAQDTTPSPDKPVPMPPHAGGESVEDSGFELDEFTPEPQNTIQGGD